MHEEFVLPSLFTGQQSSQHAPDDCRDSAQPQGLTDKMPLGKRTKKQRSQPSMDPSDEVSEATNKPKRFRKVNHKKDNDAVGCERKAEKATDVDNQLGTGNLEQENGDCAVEVQNSDNSVPDLETVKGRLKGTHDTLVELFWRIQ